MKYRSENLWGEGYRDAAAVMAHETFELANTDILITLRETILKDSPYAEKLEILEEELNNACVADGDTNGLLYNIITSHNSNDENSPSVRFFKEILQEIKRITGKDIKYCLWLCDTPEDVKRYDIHNELEDKDIDVYIESDIILSNIGVDGCLYGFETLPGPITTNEKIVKDPEITIHDSGIAIYHVPSKTFYCGYNQFDKQPRKAKIYHKESYVKQALDTIIKNGHDENKSDYRQCTVNIIVTEMKEIT